MALIKSYGNYVIQQKHQLIDNGTIFERDYSTVGGIGEGFDPKYPTYRQGTFVYEVNNEIVTTKLYNNNSWIKNGENEFWTKENLILAPSSQNSLDIILKQDSYNLKDFAYYGSCAELIRSSINDIIKRFPGELYVCEDKVLIIDDDETQLKYNDIELFVIDNPLQVDAHTPIYCLSIEEQDELRYLSSNFSNYEMINDNGETSRITSYEYEAFEDVKCESDFFGKCKLIDTNNTSIEIFFYRDEERNIIYLTSKTYSKYKIRPLHFYYNNFIESLDSFQKILLNSDSKPQYSAIFEVMEENEYGYITTYKKFVFPTSDGDYNLDVTSEDYYNYVDSLSKYALFYDETYCNNLYRHMTHESIKNFDWTDVLNRGEETKDDYIENGEKVAKLLQICGREFDEIKYYIDGIKNVNTITYNDANNIPDYFLTDTLDIEGWDVINIFPHKIVGNKIIEDLSLTISPYGNRIYGTCGATITHPDGYFSGYWEDNCVQSKNTEGTNEYYKNDKKGFLREKIQQYISNKKYTMQDVNNKFMKYLKLNSRQIFQKKGTIDGIESILSLFGLRSKRWFDSLEGNLQMRLTDEMNLGYDYEITEYVTITTPLEDANSMNNRQGLPKVPLLLTFLNGTKNIVYNTQKYKNDIDNPYKGLPVRYYDLEDGKRMLYPHFSYNKPIDGKPYYQMNGGWLHKKYKLVNNVDNITFMESDNGFVDTNTQIPMVANIKELLKLRNDVLYNGIIYYVKNIKGDYICVNNEIYDIQEDLISRYFEVPVNNGSVIIGTQEFYGEIETYSDETVYVNGTYQETYNTTIIDLRQYKNGSLLKIFIKSNKTIFVKQDENVLINYAIFKDGSMISSYAEGEMVSNNLKTNYFILNDKEWKNMLGFWGWNQLLKTDPQYLTIQSLKREYKGNNPHINGLVYDDGKEYLKYFQHIFKYAVENETFNKNCFSTLKEYMVSLNQMENEIGFNNLFIQTDCQEELNLYSDTKIHHFCDYLTQNGDANYFYEFGNGVFVKDYDNATFNTSILLLPKKYEVDSVISLYCKDVQITEDYVTPLSGATVLFWFEDDPKTYLRVSTNFGLNNPIIDFKIPNGEYVVIEQERFYAKDNKISHNGKSYNIETNGNARYITINSRNYNVITSTTKCYGIKIFLYGDYYQKNKKIRTHISESGKDYYNFYEKQDYLNLNRDNILSGTVYNNQTCLDQIINVKNIKLSLYAKTDTYDVLQVKYFDEVILHYLSQILPSNIILNVEFKIKQ